MKRKSIALLLALIVLAAFLGGCKKKVQELPVPSAPVGSKEIASGGKAISNANAKEMTITHSGTDTAVTLSFALGSKITGVDEAIADGIPAYKAYTMEAPARFVLEFDSLEFWDYDRTLDVKDDALFYSVFKQLRSGDDRFRIFFQLKENVTFKADENEDKLTITFKPEKTEPKEQHYVTANALSLFSEGTLPDTAGLFPTLCSDLENTTLISSPFDSQAAADTFKAKLLTELGQLLTADQLNVIALTGNSLPEYSSTSDFAEITNKNVIKQNGVEGKLPVIMPDGLYLCTSPDGKRTLFSKQLKEETDNTVQSTPSPEVTPEATPEGTLYDTVIDIEELWLMDVSGKFKRLSEIEFATIEQAEFSPDGKKLAILERTTDSSFLYIFDMETNSLENLGEEGFGSTTSTFVWDALGTAIYAITGNETQQLLKYDFTIPDETARISAVEEREIEEGDLGFFNGELYFANIDEQDNEQIFKIKPEGGLRNQFAAGGSFRLSPDGKSMAIIESRSTVEEETNENTNLKIKDMSTGKETYVTKDAYVISYEWGLNGTLYYIIGVENGENEAYPYRMVSYSMDTGKSSELCDLIMSDFVTSPVSGQLYLSYFSTQENTTSRSTYVLDLDKLELNK